MKQETLERHTTTLSKTYHGRPVTRGVHHLVLNTEDMKATIDFYVNVLGVVLVHAMKTIPGIGTGPGNRGNPPYEEIRHYFFDMGNDSLLAFFEIPKGAEPQVKRDAIGGMQHVAFSVAPENCAALQQRLRAAGIAYSGPVEILPGLFSIYFIDPVNGTRLEACCQPEAGITPSVLGSVLQSKAEARKELNTISGVDEAWLQSVTQNLTDKI
jgi:catechol 2,3-dioxygenase-like lactoylglutathione lyase family enzyme